MRNHATLYRASVATAGLAALGLCLLGLASPALADDAVPADPQARSPALREETTTTLVQIDVSVVDKKKDPYRSVPGLTLDHFILRIDGVPLTASERARVAFDPICGKTAPVTRPIVAVVDLNFLDAKGRKNVADALEGLAETVGASNETYKVYALTRQIRLLTPGFTTGPVHLREAARLVRESLWNESRSQQAVTSGDADLARRGTGKDGGCSG